MFVRLLNIVILFLSTSYNFIAIGQDIVATSPQNKLAVLEEFGGMYCVYCPEGHQVVNDLSSALGSDLILLNYHEGYYAVPIEGDPDLRSDFGEGILNQTGLSGFPAATINRLNFPGYEQNEPGSTALGRTDWTMACADVLQEVSPVNIAAEATLNIATRELEVYIEYYYTGDAPGTTNRLNIAILQNNVIAPQHGGAEGSYYAHQHLVRDFLTGQWGHIITNNDEGTFGSLTFNYTLPIDYRDIPVDPFNITLAAFIGEDQQNIFTGIEIVPELTSTFTNDVNLLVVYAPEDICDNQIHADLLIRNDGNEPLEAVNVSYHINNQNTEYYSWTGFLAPLQETIIELPVLYTPNSSGHHDFTAHLSIPNIEPDPTDFNNSKIHDFCVAPRVASQNLELAIRTDDFGYEMYWEILDDAGTIHASGGNMIVGETSGGSQIATPSDPGAYPSNNFFIENIELPLEGCYQLRVLDDYADGICCQYGNGFYKLRKNGDPPFLEGGAFNALDLHSFTVDYSITANNTALVDSAAKLYPNPTKRGQQLNISWPNTPFFEWQLFGLSGQLVTQGNQNLLPNTQLLTQGYYTLRLQSKDDQQSFALIIQ